MIEDEAGDSLPGNSAPVQVDGLKHLTPGNILLTPGEELETQVRDGAPTNIEVSETVTGDTNVVEGSIVNHIITEVESDKVGEVFEHRNEEFWIHVS